MSMEMTFEGMDDLFDLCEELQISDVKVRKALNIGGDIVVDAIEKDMPSDTGEMKNSVRKKITTIDGELACRVWVGKFYVTFQDWGTSYQKDNVGFFERAVEGCADKVVEAMKSEVLR